MMGKKLALRLAASWQTGLYCLVALFIVGSLLLFRLGNLVGASQVELDSHHASATMENVSKNPLNAPYKLVRQAGVKIVGHPSALALRASSAIFALIFAALFYYILKHWLTWRMAALGTLLLASSSWYLHVGRLGTDGVSQFGLVALAAYGVWSLKTRRFEMLSLVGVFLLTALIYTPGMVWFVVPALIWQRQRVKQVFLNCRVVYQVLSVLLGLALVVPLGLALARDATLILTWLGLPQHMPSFGRVISNLVNVPLNLLARGPNNPHFWVGTMPILDVFATAMAILGAYSYYFKFRLDRVRLLAILLVLGSFLISLGGPLDVTLLLPFIYILVANGFTLMVQQWFTVFPRNPLARILGLSLITVVVFLSVFYQLTNYFVAWPNAPATKEVFSASS